MPPKGLVIKLSPIPLPTTIVAQRKLRAKRKYGEMSYLSSSAPVIREIEEAVNKAMVILLSGRKKRLEARMPKNNGMPPPRGIGFLWIIAGWMCVFGSSIRPKCLLNLMARGVAITVVIKATMNGRIIVVSIGI